MPLCSIAICTSAAEIAHMVTDAKNKQKLAKANSEESKIGVHGISSIPFPCIRWSFKSCGIDGH
jgi:hypothetical protein